MSRPGRSRGFTMIEVLISIVVIGFGLLGIAGLQAFALKNSQSASQRLTATMLANDMIDRMKSNAQGVGEGHYDHPDTGEYQTPSSCTGPKCTAAQVAQNDRADWQQRVAMALPNGVGIVCADLTPHDGVNSGNPSCQPGGDVSYAVKIWWSDDRTSRAAVVPLERFSTGFNP